MALIIRSSSIHAAGCYTNTAIPKNRRVAQYTGPRLSKEQADEAYEDSPITYLFGLGKGDIVIDGHCASMFINHSCDGNCETSEIGGRVYIKSIRAIEPGEEITYDYCLYDGGDDPAFCNCGSKRCRGTMYSPEEVRRRKRATEKEALVKTKAADGAKAGRKQKRTKA